jgi:hypothetical protein
VQAEIIDIVRLRLGLPTPRNTSWSDTYRSRSDGRLLHTNPLDLAQEETRRVPAFRASPRQKTTRHIYALRLLSA